MAFLSDLLEFDAFDVGQRIRAAREAKGIKSIEMADLLDVTKNQYSRIECGTSVSSVQNLHKIAQILDVSADYLLFGNEPKEVRWITKLLEGRDPKELEKMVKVLEIMCS